MVLLEIFYRFYVNFSCFIELSEVFVPMDE